MNQPEPDIVDLELFVTLRRLEQALLKLEPRRAFEVLRDICTAFLTMNDPSAPNSPLPPADEGCGWCDIDGADYVEAVARQGVRISFDPFAWDDYYLTTHWQWIADHWKSGWCMGCAQQGPTELHHRDGNYASVGRERQHEDVVELCRACHQRQHEAPFHRYFRRGLHRQPTPLKRAA